MIREYEANQLITKLYTRYGLAPDSMPQGKNTFLAFSIRAAAGRLCPCTERTLVSATSEALFGILPDYSTSEELKVDLTNLIQDLLTYGDLLEISEAGTKIPQIYLTPPAFIRRKTGQLLILGGSPEETTPDPILNSLVQCQDHLRYIPIPQAKQALPLLTTLGYQEQTENTWLKTPPITEPKDLIQLWDNRLKSASPTSPIADLQIIDTEKPVRYYKGRWTTCKPTLTGNYIGRRPRRYGSDLWCYVAMQDGRPLRFIELPASRSLWRGCDEAWHLLAALDSSRNMPQEGTVTQRDGENSVLSLYSPIPAWAQRRLDVIGKRSQIPGCLFAYAFEPNEIEEEMTFLKKLLWLQFSTN